MRSDVFGISTILFRELPIARALEKIKRAGFSRIDLAIIPPTFCPHWDPLGTTVEEDKRLKDLILGCSLSVSSLNVMPGFFNRDDSRIVSGFIRRCIEIAKILDARVVTIPAGQKVRPQDWIASVEQVKKHLSIVARFAADRGVTLSVEAPHHNTLTETVEQAGAFLDLFDTDILACTLDTSHVLLDEKMSLEEGLDFLGIERVNHIHLRDTLGGDCTLTPGKGRGDFRRFFQKLKDGGYRGDLVIELEFENVPESFKLKELAFARRYCSAMYHEVRLPMDLRIRSSWLVQSIERLLRNPKKELRRHTALFRIGKKIYPLFLRLRPDDVYQGGWRKKFRWNKTRIVRHRSGSVIVEKHPQRIYRVGIIGCGWAGSQMHGPAFERLNNVQIVGGFDIDRKKAENFALKFRCKAFRSLEELVEKGKPDIVSVCSIEPAHYEQTLFLLENGVDVYCEKLMATRYSHAEEMVDLAEKRDRVLAVNYNYRFIPGIRKIKEIIDLRVLGELFFFYINVHSMSYAHALDLLSYLGGKIQSISAFLATKKNGASGEKPYASAFDSDILYLPSGYVTVTCLFEGGHVGIINASNAYDLDSFVLSLEVVFRKGVVTLTGINMYDVVGDLSYFSPVRIRQIDMDYKKGVFARGFEFTFYQAIQNFVKNYSEGKSPETPGTQGLFNIGLEKLIFRSDREEARISCKGLYKRS